MSTEIVTPPGSVNFRQGFDSLPKPKLQGIAKVNDRGQVKIPKEVCELLRIAEGTFVGFSVVDDKDALVVMIETVDIESSIGAGWNALIKQAVKV